MGDREGAVKAKEAGNLMYSLGDYESAINHFTRGIECDPTYHVLYSNRAGAYTQLGDYSSALADANKVISLAPTWPKGYSRKGTALLFLDRPEDAHAAFSDGVKVDPQHEPSIQGVAKARAAAVEKAKKELMAAPQPLNTTTVGGTTVLADPTTSAPPPSSSQPLSSSSGSSGSSLASSGSGSQRVGVGEKRKRVDAGGEGGGEGEGEGEGKATKKAAGLSAHLIAGANALREALDAVPEEELRAVESAAGRGHTVHETIMWVGKETRKVKRLDDLVQLYVHKARRKNSTLQGPMLVLVASDQGAPILVKHLAKVVSKIAPGMPVRHLESPETSSTCEILVMTQAAALTPGKVSAAWLTVYDFPSDLGRYLVLSNQTSRFSHVLQTFVYLDNESAALFTPLAFHWHARKVTIPLPLVHSPFCHADPVRAFYNPSSSSSSSSSDAKRVNHVSVS